MQKTYLYLCGLAIFLSCLIRPSVSLAASESRGMQEFVKGVSASVYYSAAGGSSEGESLCFRTKSENFTAVVLSHGNGVVVAVADTRNSRKILFREGALTVPSRTGMNYPKIGFTGNSENAGNEYMVGVHDFTDDGNPELVIAVSDGGDGLALFVLEYDGAGWESIGEIVTSGKGLGGCRVFRQAITMKDRSGTMLTWTCSGSSFRFLASDNTASPASLF